MRQHVPTPLWAGLLLGWLFAAAGQGAELVIDGRKSSEPVVPSKNEESPGSRRSPGATTFATFNNVGRGSYLSVLPEGAKGPPPMIYATESVQGKMPTNDWWTSLAWMPFSERQYPHPLAVQAEKGGLRIYYPGSRITANRVAIFGTMPGGTRDDFVLGHSQQHEFADAGDWNSGSAPRTLPGGPSVPACLATSRVGAR